MLENLSRDPPPEVPSDTNGGTTASSNAPSIPDPWDVPNAIDTTHLIPDAWTLPAEPHPLLNAAGSPKALRLPAPKLSPTQVLLQDGLKLRAYDGGSLAVQLRKAIALLGWMKTVTQVSPA